MESVEGKNPEDSSLEVKLLKERAKIQQNYDVIINKEVHSVHLKFKTEQDTDQNCDTTL